MNFLTTYDETTGKCLFGCGGSAVEGHAPNCVVAELSARYTELREIARDTKAILDSGATIDAGPSIHNRLRKAMKETR